MQTRSKQLDGRELELKKLEAQIDARAEQLERQVAGHGEETQEAAARLHDIDEKEAELIAREAELHRQEAAFYRSKELSKTAPVDELAEKRLRAREEELSAREAQLQKAESLATSAMSRTESKEQRLAQRTHEFGRPVHDLAANEDAHTSTVSLAHAANRGPNLNQAFRHGGGEYEQT